MTGDRDILALRRSGRRPAVVWVSSFADATLDGLTVRIADIDIPEALDLRFLVGCTALVDGSDARRVERIANACSAHAKRVVSTVYDGRDVIQIRDTEGHMTWN